MDRSEPSEIINGTYSDQQKTNKEKKRSLWTIVLKGVLLTFLFALVLGVCVTVSAVIYSLKPTLRMQEYTILTGQNVSMEGNSTIECAQQFYLNDGSECRLLCDAWVNRDTFFDVVETVLTVSTSLFCISSCVVLAVIAFIVQRDSVLTFPKFYLVYASLTTALVAFCILVGYTNKKGLFCYSNDLFDMFKYGTPFCTLSGMVFVYGLLQIFLWTMFHALGVWWIIVLPFHYRSTKNLKSVHITTVALALVIPAIPALLQLAVGGYRPYYSPPRFCSGRNAHVTFWTLLLPAMVVLAVTMFAMMVVFWIILKNLLFNYKPSVVKNAKRQVIQFGKVEVKILCVICYYVSLGVFVLIAFTYFEATHTAQLTSLMEYLECQLPGFYPLSSELEGANQCGEIPTVRLQPFYALSAVGIFQVALIPVVILGLTVRSRCTRKLHCCISRVRDMR